MIEHIQTFTQDQIDHLQRMDQSITMIQQLSKLLPFSEDGKGTIEGEIRDANLYAFENYWQATREIDPQGGIIRDEEMIAAASERLLERGIPQFIRHKK